MSTGSNVPAGWHPDPQSPSTALRWWDGSHWTNDVRPIPGSSTYPPPAAPPTWGGTGQGGSDWGGGAGSPGWPSGGSAPMAQGRPVRAGTNQLSLIGIGFTVLYVVLALTVHVVILGIVPVLMAVRAVNRREPMAPFAVVAAVVAVGVAIIGYSGHL